MYANESLSVLVFRCFHIPMALAAQSRRPRERRNCYFRIIFPFSVSPLFLPFLHRVELKHICKFDIIFSCQCSSKFARWPPNGTGHGLRCEAVVNHAKTSGVAISQCVMYAKALADDRLQSSKEKKTEHALNQLANANGRFPYPVGL